MRRRRGFTLVELLVVIGIIALLVSILLPALGRARNAAKTTACLSNLRQLSMAWNMYIGEFRKIPAYPTMTADGEIWVVTLQPYCNNTPQMLTCPALPIPDTSGISSSSYQFGTANQDWVEHRQGETSPWDHSSYTYNGNLYYPAPSSGSWTDYGVTGDHFQGVTSILDSTVVPIFGDGDWRDATPGQRSAATPGSSSLPKHWPDSLVAPDTTTNETQNYDQAYQFCTNRHGAVTNLAYVDGHAESIRLTDVWEQQWSVGYTPTPASGVTGTPKEGIPH